MTLLTQSIIDTRRHQMFSVGEGAQVVAALRAYLAAQ